MEDLKYLTEAFQDLNILNEDTFDINADGLAELTSFYNDNDMADLETVIDPVAQTEEELQDSYIGKAILDCVICQSKIYKDPEDVIISEDGSLANVGEICPYCQSSDGYKVIGQVAEYCPHCDDEDVKVETDEAEITVDVDKKEDEELNENLKVVDILTPGQGEVYKLRKQYPDHKYMRLGYADYDKDSLIKEFNNEDIILDIVKDVDIDKVKADLSDYSRDHEIILLKTNASNTRNKTDIPGTLGMDKNESLKEDMQNISIETDKERINISSEPKEEVKSDDEMIAPLEPETEEEFKSEVEETEPEYSDVDIDEFEESDFDELGEKYLKRVYENVKSYKTIKGSTQGNRLKLEGLITFKSGKEAKTNFVFEAKSATKTGKLKFLGENKQFARGRQAFTLTGRADGKKLIAESLTYNYRAKNPETKESKRLYGTVSSSKLR